MMDVLTVKDIAGLLTPVLTLIIGVGIGIIGYFLKAMHADIREKFREADARIDRVDRDLMEFKAQMPRQYVLRDDFIRIISSLEYKIDGLGAKIDRLVRGNNGES